MCIEVRILICPSSHNFLIVIDTFAFGAFTARRHLNYQVTFQLDMSSRFQWNGFDL